MALEAGTRLGHYEVVSSLGAGGMGEVYRAKDTKLGREVAIKVLPEGSSDEPERMARFEREAKVLAGLNHTNIATLYSFEADGKTRFLVMEVVEGETLADRIARGPIPVDEALPLFLQIAEGLEAAHEKGVIHRDLKPANIKVTDAGNVKILDFGLAKALAPVGESETDPSESPTITAAGYDRTVQGQILGTAAYMSPEQVRGGDADRRSDVWAFGCCLFEALSGERAFAAETAQDTLAKVLEREPRWDALPATVPHALRRLLQHCVEKRHRERLHDIGDARLLLSEASSQEHEASAAAPIPSTYRRVAIGAAVALAVALAALAGWLGRGQSPAGRAPQPVRRFSVNLAPELPLNQYVPGFSGRNLALSPDGTTLVYVANTTSGGGDLAGTVLVRRDLEGLEAEVLAGTEGATEPVFSPDGRQLVFWVQGEGLRKIELDRGRPQVVYASEHRLMPGGLSWSEDGFIYFAPAKLGGVLVVNSLLRVSDTGDGGSEVVFPTDGPSDEWYVANPELLPGGRALLFSVLTGLGVGNSTVEVLDLETGERRALVEQAGGALFVGDGSSSRGHIVYTQLGKLMVSPFDAERLELAGPPVEVTESTMRMTDDTPRRWTVARNGTLVYSPGNVRSLVLVDRSGAREVLTAAPTPHPWEYWPSLSPDGRSIAVTSLDDNIWVYDVERQSSIRVTSSASIDLLPFWSRDGEHLLFSSVRYSGTRDLFRKRADGTGRAELLAAGPYNINAKQETIDGSAVVFYEWGDPETSDNIGLLHLDGTGSVERLLWTESVEREPVLSPNGRWLAYNSDESGQQEVYVRAFPGMERRTRVSTAGGQTPRWHPSGREIFYWNDGGLVAVEVETSSGFSAGLPEVLFAGSYMNGFDVFPSGNRFVMVDGTSGDHELVVVENWAEELEGLAPTD